MKELKSIWNQLNETQFELGSLIHQDNINNIFTKLEKEQELRKKYAPLVLLVFIGTMLLFSWLVYISSNQFGFLEISGILLVTLGSYLIIYLPQYVKIPLEKYRYDQSSIEFLSLVKVKLQERKKMLLYGLITQFICLIGGIYLLITASTELNNPGLFNGVYFGFMLSLAGFGIGETLSMFNRQYDPLLKRIEIFLQA